MNLFLLIVALVCIAIGVGGGYLLFRYVLTGMLRRQLDEAEKEAQVIKEKKLLEVKEKFLNKKAELEKEVQQRSQRILQSENKLKQREMVTTNVTRT